MTFLAMVFLVSADAAEPVGSDDCTTTPTANALADLLNDAQRAYRELDIERFQQRTDQVRSILPCVSDPMPPYLVARLHRVQGLRAFGVRVDWAAGAFAAARAVEPDYAFPPELVPPNHPIHDLYRSKGVIPTQAEPVPVAGEGEVWVDGKVRDQRPLDRPAVFQHIVDGRSVTNAYLLPDIPLPSYAVAPAAPDPVESPVPTARQRGKGLKIPLLAATAATTAAAAGAWTLSAVSHSRFQNPSTTDDALPGLRSRTNTATVTAGVLGGSAVVLGAATVVVW